ncbi:DNA polymerase-3 subunit delta' [Branchiibius hedensis]|uniref:DNA polymerase III subunit delta' n=1 Tax=Branchiibius hedensis TaxID=672460 RepID=A0A2Y9A2A0_9MICO|nr:DNA polymerase III subunit delta' [Branchiibius hedensis]PWJ27517.1 DNA polymerase-3 subunit delta' [Branchiibius hedensis]SSA36327.1 DNA polymerase-3 subunit delta' [Branchiibius hedensis]
MSVWTDVIGQPHVVRTLGEAVADPAANTHAWLLTGPPGSGRSTAARAFAAALECPRGGCGECAECRTALDGSHADVELVATQGLSISVKEARRLTELAQRRPSIGAWRVIVIEDADRLTEQAADALLKSLEEPTARTIWLLCAPSVEDVIITIRSRSRHLGLRTPPPEAVAQLLSRRDGIDPDAALAAARAAQSHVGLARRLARDPDARARRDEIVALPLRITDFGAAMAAADALVQVAGAESGASAAERNAAEREKLLLQLGADPAARTQPPAVRSALTQLEKDQKARATRFTRDMVDRALIDLASTYRDALMLSVGAQVDLVNVTQTDAVQELARRLDPAGLLQALDAIGLARTRIEANVPPQLALEAMAISLQIPAQSRR